MAPADLANVPPNAGAFSSRVTRAPTESEANAAALPAMPAPTITTSVSAAQATLPADRTW